MSSIYFILMVQHKLFSDLSRYIFKYFSKIVFFSEYRVRECRVYVLSLPESIKANSIAIHTRTPGRCALSRCTMGLTGVACVLLTWREPVRVTPFFSLHRSFFFHSPFHSSLPLADLGDYSQVWRHARRRDRQYARVCVWAHACPRCVPATKAIKSFSRIRAKNQKSHSVTSNDTPTQDLYYAARNNAFRFQASRIINS